MTKCIQINAADNVAVAISDLHSREVIDLNGTHFVLKEDIPAGHKFLLKDTRTGEPIIKYGYPIGRLTGDLQQGQWVNEQNLMTNLGGLLTYEYKPVFSEEQLRNGDDAQVDYPTEGLPTTFMGFRRRNGEVGIRNEIWVVPTTTDDVRVLAFPHNYGCSQLGEDHEQTRKILRDLVRHPNAGAVLVVGLGCENNQPESFRNLLGDYDQERIRFMVTQQIEGDEMEVGRTILTELKRLVAQDVRTEIPLNELRVGLKCGGSDGFSGITANPLLGLFSDFLVSQGGTTVLTEVPEMFGAETILMNRCANRDLFEYFSAH